MKILNIRWSLVIVILALIIIIIFEINKWPVGGSVAAVVLGYFLPGIINWIHDIFDPVNWKVSQRRLEHAGLIVDNTILRISFAYLYRIKVGNKYLLVKNARGTGKYQPVGGVYKLLGNEKLELKNRYQVKDDDKISIDKSSRDDYRLRIENKYLVDFIRRFDCDADREQIYNLSREFKEELVDKGILNWNEITYRFCGRHMTEIYYDNYFKCYELLLADIVELLPTIEQELDLERLASEKNDAYCFVTADEIFSLGINTDKCELKEFIADHSMKMVQETEGQLMRLDDVGKKYTVNL